MSSGNREETEGRCSWCCCSHSKGQNEDDNDNDKKEKEPSEFNLRTCFVICVTFLIQAICSGQMLTVYEYYSVLLEAFGESRSTTAWVGSISMTVAQCTGAFSYFILPKLGYRKCIMIGAVGGTAGLVASYLATSILHLIFSYGVVFAIGLALTMLGSIDALRMFFQKYLFIALSITFSGAGFGMMIISPYIRYLIETYGWRGAYLLQGGLNLQMCVLGALLIPPRIKSSAQARRAQMANAKPMTFVQRCLEIRIWLLSLCLFLVGGGIVTLYVIFKDLALLRNLEAYIPAASQALGIGNIIGRFFSGFIAMVVNPLYITVINKFFVTAIPFLYVATPSGEMFIALAAILGVTHGLEFTTLAMTVVHMFGPVEMAVSLGFVFAFGGLGTLMMPPVAGYLTDQTGSYNTALLLSGSCGAVSIIFSFVLFFTHRRKVRLMNAAKQQSENLPMESEPLREKNGAV